MFIRRSCTPLGNAVDAKINVPTYKSVLNCENIAVGELIPSEAMSIQRARALLSILAVILVMHTLYIYSNTNNAVMCNLIL
jgi:hypothetical protein